LLLSRKDLDLLYHTSDSLGLLLSRTSLFTKDFIKLIGHFVELIHAALVEFDVLVYIHFVAVHDIEEAV
jgi:hypothetical protein